jgi:hypothetical protein
VQQAICASLVQEEGHQSDHRWIHVFEDGLVTVSNVRLPRIGDDESAPCWPAAATDRRRCERHEAVRTFNISKVSHPLAEIRANAEVLQRKLIAGVPIPAIAPAFPVRAVHGHATSSNSEIVIHRRRVQLCDQWG